jgi:hypothetical protein
VTGETLNKAVNGEKGSDDPFGSNGRIGQDDFAKDLTAALFVSIPKSGRKVKNRNGSWMGKREVPGQSPDRSPVNRGKAPMNRGQAGSPAARPYSQHTLLPLLRLASLRAPDLPRDIVDIFQVITKAYRTHGEALIFRIGVKILGFRVNERDPGSGVSSSGLMALKKGAPTAPSRPGPLRENFLLDKGLLKKV